MQVLNLHSTLSYWPITRSVDMGCHWLYVSVTSWSDWLDLFGQGPLYFYNSKAYLSFKRCETLFQQNNAGLNVASIVRTFLDEGNFLLMLYPSNSPDFSLTENVWSMVSKWTYASQYCQWNVVQCWSCMNSCICRCHPISAWFNALAVNNCYCCRTWLIQVLISQGQFF